MIAEQYSGIAASPGIGMGKVFLLEKEELVIVRRDLRAEEVKREIRRFRAALARTTHEMKEDKQKMMHVLGKSHARLGDAYLFILQDPILTKDIEKEIAKERVNAEFAIQNALERISHTFDALSDDYFRERKNDILEVGNKILRYLLGKEKKELGEITEECIVVAHNLLPSDTANLKTSLIRGFAIDVGGQTSHTALLARSLEIPAVVGLKDISGKVKSGQFMIVDGTRGKILVDPDAATIRSYRRAREVQVRESRELVKLRNLPSQTADGKRIELSANIDTADDAKAAAAYGAEGIGLFRTEYLFINREDLPNEEEQYAQYSRAAKQMKPHTTLFRTLDIGGDKLAPFIENFANESNPFLGLRAVRFCLKYPDIFRVQLRALLRTAEFAKVRIMFPMISGLQDFMQAKQILMSVREELINERYDIPENIEIGAMIEVPSAALTSDIIAREADFFSIGTNDLIQYTLAVDRVNENVASLYEPSHLAILRLIKMVADNAHAHGKWVGMCGEMASDITFTRVLLGLGLDELSVAPSFIPRIKKIIRSTHLTEARKIAQEILSAKDNASAQERLNQLRPALA